MLPLFDTLVLWQLDGEKEAAEAMNSSLPNRWGQ
jgi:hypothetical protein